MSVSKRIVLTLTLLSVTFAGIRPASAQDWTYQQQAYPVGYPAGYPAPYEQPNNHEVLKKVLVGGALVGLGFLAGRLSAPKPNYGYAPQGPQFQPQWNQQMNYRGPQGHHGHRF